MFHQKICRRSHRRICCNARGCICSAAFCSKNDILPADRNFFLHAGRFCHLCCRSHCLFNCSYSSAIFLNHKFFQRFIRPSPDQIRNSPRRTNLTAQSNYNCSVNIRICRKTNQRINRILHINVSLGTSILICKRNCTFHQCSNFHTGFR